MYDSVSALRACAAGLQAILDDLDRIEASSAAAVHVQWAIDLLKQEMAALAQVDRPSRA